ncbi:MAG: hypothetical protein QXS83_00460, partial [Thermoplasmata archaeon]
QFLAEHPDYVEAVFCGHNHTNAYFRDRTQTNINDPYPEKWSHFVITTCWYETNTTWYVQTLPSTEEK